MDNTQKNHLKAYGLAYWVLEREAEIEWLLNYRGGSFIMDHFSNIEKECKLRGISYEIVSSNKALQIKEYISNPAVNANTVQLVKAPKIAVYSP